MRVNRVPVLSKAIVSAIFIFFEDGVILDKNIIHEICRIYVMDEVSKIGKLKE